MVFSYNECKKIYKNWYGVKQAIDDESLFKIKPGVYSDIKNASEISVIKMKYPNAVFTMGSAFFYHKLTDTIPKYYCLLTDKNASKICDSNIKQYFDNSNSLKLGLELLTFNGEQIPVFSKERMLIELMRNKTSLPYDYYKEIINSYRKLIHILDFQLIEEYAEKLPKTKLVLRAIESEVL